MKYAAAVLIAVLTAAVSVSAAVIPADDIRDAITAYIEGISSPEGIEYSPNVPNMFDIEVESDGETVIEVFHDPDRAIGQVLPLTVTIKATDGEMLRELRVSPKLRKIGIAAALNRDVARGEIISESDVELVKTDITAERGVCFTVDEVRGMEAKKHIKEGSVLSASDIRAPYAVERGDTVTVEVRKQGILLRTEGTARQNGAVGEVIKIFVEMTRATISCKIVDSATVVANVQGG